MAGIKIESARELIAAHTEDQGEKAVWPRRCATSQILLRNEDGKIVETDLFFSAEMTEDGQFDVEATNPLVIHDTDNGVPKHQYAVVQVRDRNRNVRTWVSTTFGAFVARFFDRRIPAEEQAPEESLGSPKTDDVEVPT